MRISRWLLAPALFLVLTSFPAVGADAATQADRPDPKLSATPLAKPKVKLDKPVRGAAALKALQGQLDVAADANQTSVAKLAKELKTDPTAWIATNGRLFYADLTTGELKEFQLPPQFAPTGVLPNGLTVHGFGQDGQGELYAMVTNTPSNGTGGIVYKFVPIPEPQAIVLMTLAAAVYLKCRRTPKLRD